MRFDNVVYACTMWMPIRRQAPRQANQMTPSFDSRTEISLILAQVARAVTELDLILSLLARSVTEIAPIPSQPPWFVTETALIMPQIDRAVTEIV